MLLSVVEGRNLHKHGGLLNRQGELRDTNLYPIRDEAEQKLGTMCRYPTADQRMRYRAAIRRTYPYPCFFLAFPSSSHRRDTQHHQNIYSKSYFGNSMSSYGSDNHLLVLTLRRDKLA
jgi:hypothetical protein